MTPEQINDQANIIALTAGIPALLFTLVYGFGSPWYRSWLGRTVFGLMFAISMLFGVILARRFFGTYPGYEWVSVICYTLLTVAFWSFFIILLVERKHGNKSELHIPLTKEGGIMKKVAEWFTPERRQAIQVWFGSLAPLLILAGFATQEQTEQVLIIIGAILQFLASILSLVNVRVGDIAAAWAVVRGAIYGLAAVVSPALVILGVYSDDVNAQITVTISLTLSSLSSLLAIFTSGKQQLEGVEHAHNPLAK